MIKTYDTLPTHCEYCDSELVWDSVNLMCNNPMCPNKAEEKIKSWCLNIAPIDGLGWTTIKKLLDTSYFILERIDSIEKLYYIARNPMARHHSVKPGSEVDLFNKMLDKLCGPISISQFLLALKIPGLGKIGAKTVENSESAKIAFESILCFQQGKDNFVDVDNVWAKLLQDVNTAKSLYTTYNEYFKYCYKFIKDQIVFDTLFTQNAFKNNKDSVAITGTLSIKRNDFIRLLESNGWIVDNKIKSSTKYLITNTPNSETSKNKEADKLGIEKITEKDFVDKYIH